MRKDCKKFCFIHKMSTNVHKSLHNLCNKPRRIELKSAFLSLFVNLSVHQEWIRESCHCNIYPQARTYYDGPHFVKQRHIRERRLSAAVIPAALAVLHVRLWDYLLLTMNWSLYGRRCPIYSRRNARSRFAIPWNAIFSSKRHSEWMNWSHC